MKHIISTLARSPQRLFLIDGIGAIISASLLLLVRSLFPSFFHIPQETIYTLAGIAYLFAAYSIFFSQKKATKWPLFLQLIATANALYCLATLILVFIYFSHLSLLEILYFLIEIIIILTLVYIEYSVALFSRSND
jgi:hypothetical protein